MFNLEHIEFLLVLAAVPLFILLYVLALARKRKMARKLGDPQLVKQLTRYYHPGKFALKFLLIIIAFTALAFAFANVRSADESEDVKRNGIDVMVALDVSNSMLAQDISPTRLDRAKQVIGRVIDKLGNDRIGLVIFAGKAYLQMPLTADHGAAKLYLSSTTTASVPTQGTVIGDALKMCYLSFNNQDKKYKTVLLFSDGEDHDEGAIDLAKKMAADGVVIHTVGVGSPGGASIPDAETGGLKMDVNGNVVVTKLNETTLQKIATASRGQYQLFTNTDAVVNNIIGQLKTMDQRKIRDDSLMNYKSYFQYFLALAFLFLLIELFISERRKKVVQAKVKPAVSLVGIMLLFTITSFAQEDKELVKEGNVAFQKKNYPTAIAAYKKAAELNPANQAAIYNLGNALYKNGDSSKAITAYEMSVKSAKFAIDKSNSYYNKGVVYHNSKRLPDCIEAYKSALRINPNDEDARQNLQKALQEQKQKQNSSSQQNKNKNQSPKPQPSKLSQQDAADKLNALEQQEKNIHDKLKKVNVNAANKPEKDW
ncbi:MAG: VWA domain-containing protein [Ferruginibacter sp.]